MTTVAIVGAGPAGASAARELISAGLRPVVIDEAPRAGGQVFRQPPDALKRPAKELYGLQSAQAGEFFSSWSALEGSIDYRAGALVWQIEDRTLHLLRQGRAEQLPFDALVLATGATDRVFPFPGWTLPGVFTLGGAQVLLKSQAALAGPRIVFAGSGPLLYLVATQYLKAGARIQAVLDTAPPGSAMQALPGLLARPRLAAAGMAMQARLRAAAVTVRHGVSLVRAHGDAFVRAIEWRDGMRTTETACDAIAFGHGLRSETQLADLAGCAFDFDTVEQAWLPRRDEHGRTSEPGVYVAGDGAGIRGADAAAIAGTRAAHALLDDFGIATQRRPKGAMPMRPHDRWRQAISVLSEPPRDWAASAPDTLVVCRCENVTAGELRACASDTGTSELNRLKALSRIGMGRCQGRMCGAAASRLLAQAANCDLRDVGRLRSQPPVKPVPVTALGAAIDEPTPVPADEIDD